MNLFRPEENIYATKDGMKKNRELDKKIQVM